jgi:hypothetical protein
VSPDGNKYFRQAMTGLIWDIAKTRKVNNSRRKSNDSGVVYPVTGVAYRLRWKRLSLVKHHYKTLGYFSW